MYGLDARIKVDGIMACGIEGVVRTNTVRLEGEGATDAHAMGGYETNRANRSDLDGGVTGRDIVKLYRAQVRRGRCTVPSAVVVAHVIGGIVNHVATADKAKTVGLCR